MKQIDGWGLGLMTLETWTQEMKGTVNIVIKGTQKMIQNPQIFFISI